MSKRGTTLERFERHYIPEPNLGCWLWTAAVRPPPSLPYGLFHVGGDLHTASAHTVAWELFRGDRNGLCVLHRCDVPCCVNPDHLFLGTKKDNTDDRVSKGRGTTKPGELHPRSTLTNEIVLAIRADPRATRFVAAEHGINKATVRKIKRRALWSHI